MITLASKYFIYKQLCYITFMKLLEKEFKILSFTIKKILSSNIISNANSLAFSTILSLVPILSVLFMFFKVFGGKELVDNNLKPYIYKFLNPVSSKQINDYMDSFINSSTIETLGIIGFLFLIVTVFSIISSIEKVFNKIWEIENNRTFLKKIKNYWLIITLSPLLFLFSLSFTRLFKYLYNNFSFLETYFTFITFEIISFFLSAIFLSILLMFIPNCSVKFKYAFKSSLVATILYYIGKEIFLYYTKMAVSYHTIYGSMAVLPLFFIWIFVFWLIILFSVELNFVSQNIYYLELEEKYKDINYYDYIKLGIILSKKILDDYVNSKPVKNIFEISKDLEIPISKIRLCLSNLENANIFKKKYEDGQEYYIPYLPINQIKLSTIINGLNKSYIDNIFLPNENYFINNDILIEYKNIKNDKLIINI